MKLFRERHSTLASQARKQKLAENLTGTEHGSTPKRTSKTVTRISETAKRSHINVE